MNWALAQGRYVGPLPQEQVGEALKDRMNRFVAALRAQQVAAAKLDVASDSNLKKLRYGG